MNLQTWGNKTVSEAKKQETYPTNYVVEISLEKPEDRLELDEDVEKIQEHMEITDEARKLYMEGKVVSWEDFVGNESR